MESELSSLKKANSNLMRVIEQRNKEIRLLSSELALALDAMPDGCTVDMNVVAHVNRIHALEDVYRCLRDDYLPFFLANNRGKELQQLVMVIGR